MTLAAATRARPSAGRRNAQMARATTPAGTATRRTWTGIPVSSLRAPVMSPARSGIPELTIVPRIGQEPERRRRAIATTGRIGRPGLGETGPPRWLGRRPAPFAVRQPIAHRGGDAERADRAGREQGGPGRALDRQDDASDTEEDGLERQPDDRRMQDPEARATSGRHDQGRCHDEGGDETESRRRSSSRCLGRR